MEGWIVIYKSSGSTRLLNQSHNKVHSKKTDIHILQACFLLEKFLISLVNIAF